MRLAVRNFSIVMMALTGAVTNAHAALVDNGNGTVTDSVSGLMWVKDANQLATANWSTAVASANNLVYAGFDDWRLPEKSELEGLSGALRSSGSYNPAPFLNMQLDGVGDWYWSGTKGRNYCYSAYYCVDLAYLLKMDLAVTVEDDPSYVLAVLPVRRINVAPQSYSINTQAAPGAQVTTGYNHNQLSSGLTPYYGYYQTAFPSMNDLGAVAARLPGTAMERPALPIWQVLPTGGADGTVAAVWENGVVKQLALPVFFKSQTQYDGWLSPSKQVIVEGRGCRDYYLDGYADNSACGGRATAINNAGTVIGSNHNWPPMGSSYFEKPYRWIAPLTRAATAYPRPTISGYAWSQGTNPTDINERGSVVGTGITEGGAGPQDTYEHGLIDIAGGTSKYIGVKYQRSRAHAVNESDAVTGAAFYDVGNVYDGTTKPWRAYVWANDVINFLSVLPNSTYSEGYDINDNNVVVGMVVDAASNSRAFRWQSATGMQDLGTLGGAHSVARSVNNAGVIVGAAMNAASQYRAFVYQNSQMYDLNNYVSLPSGWSLVDAYTVNERNQILVRASNASGDAYWILNPPTLDQGDTLATAQQVSLNSDNVGSIDRAGDVDYFKLVFDTAGVVALSTTGSTDTVGELRDANGNVLVSNDNGATLNFSLNRALVAGTYFVSVHHNSSAGTGAYTLLSRFTPDDGDAYADATYMPINGSRSASIELAGDVDVFSLYVPANGVLTVNTTGGTNTKGTLRNVEGTVLATNDDYTDANFRIQANVNAGIYSLQVEHNSASGTGAYTLVSQFATAAIPVDDHGDTTGAATPISLGVAKSGKIGSYGDVDYFTVTTANTGTLIVNLPGAMPVASEIYNSAGAYVAGSSNTTGNLSYIYTNAPAGTYYVRVVHYYTLGTGDYAVTVTQDIEGDTTATAVPLAVGGSVAAKIDYVASYAYGRDTDVFKIDVTSAGWLTVKSTGTTDVTAYITNTSGTWIAANDNYLGSNNFQMTVNVAVGTYYVWVNAANAALGSYTVNASLSASEPVDSVGNTTAAATTMTLGSAYSAAIEYFGDVDMYRVDAPAKGYLKVTGTSSAGVLVTMLDASANVLVSSVSNPIALGVVVPAAATYYVKVERNTLEVMTYNVSTQFVADDYGDTSATAAALALGGSINANTFPGDTDYFSIVVPTAGLLTITSVNATVPLSGTLLSASSFWSLYNAYASGSDNNIFVAYNVTPGTYYFYVNGNSPNIGSYTLQANLSATSVDDAGNTLSTAKTIALNTTTSAAFETSNDIDYFRLDITQPAMLDIGTTGAMNTYIYLFDAAGNLLYQNDDGGGTWGVNGHLTYGITEPGAYYLSVQKSNSLIGPYTVVNSLTALPVDDYGNTRATAATIMVNGSKSGVSNFRGDADYFAFQVTASTGISIYSAGTNGHVVGTLYDANGNQLVSIGGGYYWDFSITYPVAPGTYYVKVTGIANESGTAYTLNVKELADDAGNSIATAKPVAANSTTTAMFDYASDIDYFSVQVTGNAGIDVWATGSPVYATTLYDAAGVVLGSSYYANNHIYYAAAPGTYFVRVSTYSSTGAYAL
ncbi:MAG: DUF1566 domain-containing protein, partial [Gammaproteobacteria bacterium]|nr:DUF1566 domain-containing protein [Gammaproteobacteria bacterium]